MGFADYHTLHNSYWAGDISAEINSIRILEDSLCSVNDWMGQNKLQINPSKTEFISFGSKTMIKRITRTNITVCDDTISCSSCIKLLGSYLDQSLTTSTHITKKCSLAMWNLSWIRSIKIAWIWIPLRPLFRPYGPRTLTIIMHCSRVFPQKT